MVMVIDVKRNVYIIILYLYGLYKCDKTYSYIVVIKVIITRSGV